MSVEVAEAQQDVRSNPDWTVREVTAEQKPGLTHIIPHIGADTLSQCSVENARKTV